VDVSIDAAIIGVDGSGKSTCFKKTLEGLAESHTVIGIGDEVYIGSGGDGVRRFGAARWTGLKRRFRSTAKTVRNPLLYEMAKLAELVSWSRIHKEIHDYFRPEVVLSDGAPLLNIAAWGIRYHPEFFHRFQCLKALRYLSGRARIPPTEALFYLKNMPELLLLNWSGIAPFAVPHIVFFLRVSPEVAMNRIRRRGEEIQTHETLDFLAALQGAYELVCGIVETDLGGRVHRISADDMSPDEAAAEIISRVRDNMEQRARNANRQD